MIHRAIATGVLAVAVVMSVIPRAADAAPPRAAVPKVMLYGDSLTHAFNSDWSWRYRLWQSLKESNTPFDFVGPRNDVIEYTSLKMGNQDYRQPGFDRDHASIGGLHFLSGPYQLGELVRTYRPNVVVALVGLNDLMAGASVADLERHWRQQITAARRYHRGVDIVLVQVPHTWVEGVTQYDEMLTRLGAELDSATERVIVSARPNFDKWADVFDYLHLTSAGDLKMASVVAEELAELGIGDGQPATTPDPPDDHTWAPVPTASVEAGTVTVRWPAVTYATHEHVFVRDEDTGDTAAQQFVGGTSATFPGTAGHTYSVWLAPVRGYLPIGTTSPTITIAVPAA